MQAQESQIQLHGWHTDLPDSMIMKIIRFSSQSSSLLIEMIDEQHNQLFTYADEAYELLNDEFTPDKYDRIDILLEKLYDYTVKHLADEEAYMESIHYNKLFTQKVQHQAFIEKLDEFMESHNKEEENQDEQIMKILTYLTEWLVNHILYVDGQIPQE